MQNSNKIRDLVYGVSGSGKTSWWLQLARYLYIKQGLKTRWYLGDGGYATLFVHEAEKFLHVMPYNLWDHPLETTAKICEGYWPENPEQPNSRLLPTSADQFAEYGLFVYEGLSVMSDYIMGDRLGGLANRMAKGEMLNKDESFRLKDGDMQFGGNARTHYGFAQRRITDCIERTRMLPVHVGWTAHERRVEDEEYREVWIGPDVAGKMLTTKIGGSFGNTIHLHPVKQARKHEDAVTHKTVDEVIITRRAYTRTHVDPEAQHHVKFYANTRLDPALGPTDPTNRQQLIASVMPEFLQPPDPVQYYLKLEQLRVQAAKQAVANYETINLTL